MNIMVPKNKPCKRNNRQISDNTKIAAKQGNAEERPDAGCEIKWWKRRQKCRRFSIFHRISLKRINLRGLGTESPTAVRLQICPQSISQTENTPDPSL